jgi:hypothetical protein
VVGEPHVLDLDVARCELLAGRRTRWRAPRRGIRESVRAIFAVYLVVIVAGLTYFTLVGF